MESPIRKMQKRNDYQRHKLFRKIKRKRDAQLEQLKNIAEKELRRKLRRPKYGEGKDDIQEVQMEDGTIMRVHPSALRSNELIVTTPDVVVKGKGPYRSAFNGDDVLEFANILTAGGLNNLSPTQWYGRIKHLDQVANGHLNEYLDLWMAGNEGIVPRKIFEEHPTASMIANMIVDGSILAAPSTLRYAALKAANKYRPVNNALLREIQHDPNLYTNLDVSDANGMNAVRKFYAEDVFPRYKKLMQDDGQEFNINSNDFINNHKIKKADIAATGTDGFHDPITGEIVIDNKFLEDPREFVNIGSHELRHALDHAYHPNGEFENYYINKAYNPKGLQGFDEGVKEGKAINTGVRGQIAYDYNKYGTELDDVIRNMHDAELQMYYPENHTPGAEYFMPYLEPGMKDIRNALMYVPTTFPLIMGATHIKDESDDIPTYGQGKSPGIYINPKNRGKFNALKKRTGKTTEELTHSKNPLTRKRAIFAQNARKWRHK